MPGGVYRVALPRTDLKVTLDGVEIKPALALGSWLAFQSMGNEVMVMGDLVLTEDEINPVLKTPGGRRGGDHGPAQPPSARLACHDVHACPRAWHADEARHDPARGPRGEPDAVRGETAGISPAGRNAGVDDRVRPSQKLDLDTAAIDQALGRKGKVNGGVYQVSVPRAEMPKDSGMEVPEAMGSAIAINFQPTGSGKAAITGDFVLTADEVNPVIRALQANGIEVTALHNHMLNDEPRLFFMHFWANDDAAEARQGTARRARPGEDREELGNPMRGIASSLTTFLVWKRVHHQIPGIKHLESIFR